MEALQAPTTSHSRLCARSPCTFYLEKDKKFNVKSWKSLKIKDLLAGTVLRLQPVQ